MLLLKAARGPTDKDVPERFAESEPKKESKTEKMLIIIWEMMGWHHADRSTFSVHIKTVGITGEEWISASYLSLIETNGFMFPVSLFNLLFPNRHFESGRNKGEWTLLIVQQVQSSLSFSPVTHFVLHVCKPGVGWLFILCAGDQYTIC